MAGNFEEPFRLSFQADSLHSGSISFGRFEAESLSWERRSSFSHNRYLEEVEKYSKPGSVTEKKAYFEAHFRRKALLNQGSAECQNGTECQTSEDGNLQNMGYAEEFENVNEDTHFTHFDKSPDCWEYDGECEVLESEREDTGVLYFEPQVEPSITSVNVLDRVREHVKPEEAHQTETENLLVINNEPEVEDSVNDEVIHVGVTSKAIDSLPGIQAAEKDDIGSSGHPRIPSPKVRNASETELTKPRLMSQFNFTPVQGTIPIEASEDSAKKLGRRDGEGSLRTKTEKKLSQTAAPTTHSMGRTPKPKDLGGSKAKIIHENKSIEKELRAKKVVESQSLALEKFVPRARQTANRPKQTVSSSKPGMRQSAAVFNLKSDDRAEKRKEYFVKLEEQMNAKEAQMTQIQAKTLEKTEAEIKQFRKSLNFKATPMPSFYHESVCGSGRHKAVSSNTKSSKSRNKSSSNLGAGAAESSTPFVPFGTSANSLTSAPDISHPLEAGMNSKVTGKQEREKEKNTNLQKHRVSDGSKVVRGQRVEAKRKVGAGRSSNDIMRKDMKGVYICSGSKTGNLAVGVAS